MNKEKQENKLKVTLSIQVLSYSAFVYYMYTSIGSKDNTSLMGGLFFLGAFFVLGVINLLLAIKYMQNLNWRWVQLNKIILFLVALCVLCILTYPFVSGWAEVA